MKIWDQISSGSKWIFETQDQSIKDKLINNKIRKLNCDQVEIVWTEAENEKSHIWIFWIFLNMGAPSFPTILGFMLCGTDGLLSMFSIQPRVSPSQPDHIEFKTRTNAITRALISAWVMTYHSPLAKWESHYRRGTSHNNKIKLTVAYMP